MKKKLTILFGILFFVGPLLSSGSTVFNAIAEDKTWRGAWTEEWSEDCSWCGLPFDKAQLVFSKTEKILFASFNNKDALSDLRSNPSGIAKIKEQTLTYKGELFELVTGDESGKGFVNSDGDKLLVRQDCLGIPWAMGEKAAVLMYGAEDWNLVCKHGDKLLLYHNPDDARLGRYLHKNRSVLDGSWVWIPSGADNERSHTFYKRAFNFVRTKSGWVESESGSLAELQWNISMDKRSAFMVEIDKEQFLFTTDGKGGGEIYWFKSSKYRPPSTLHRVIENPFERNLLVLSAEKKVACSPTGNICRKNIYGDCLTLILPANTQKELEKSVLNAESFECRLVHDDMPRFIDDLVSRGTAPPGFKMKNLPEGPVFVRDPVLSSEKTPFPSREELNQFSGKPRVDFMLMEDIDRDGTTIYRPYYLELREQGLGRPEAAYIDYTQQGIRYLAIKLTPQSMRRLYKLTCLYAPHGDNNLSSQGRRLAIILEDKLYAVPVIEETL